VTKAIPLKDAQGCVTAWFGVTTDIHDQKELQEQLRDADRRKDEFLATLAHELRNPLTPVRAALELMHRAGGDMQLLDEARSTMDRQIAQMVRLIDDLLDVNRITRNTLELRKELVDLASVVQHAVEACRPICDKAGHELRVTLPRNRSS
jgi:signal transduction histidine kinase